MFSPLILPPWWLRQIFCPGHIKTLFKFFIVQIAFNVDNIQQAMCLQTSLFFPTFDVVQGGVVLAFFCLTTCFIAMVLRRYGTCQRHRTKNWAQFKYFITSCPLCWRQQTCFFVAHILNQTTIETYFWQMHAMCTVKRNTVRMGAALPRSPLQTEDWERRYPGQW